MLAKQPHFFFKKQKISNNHMNPKEQTTNSFAPLRSIQVLQLGSNDHQFFNKQRRERRQGGPASSSGVHRPFDLQMHYFGLYGKVKEINQCPA